MTERVGIVGAGIAGLACAERLAERGIDVSLFDKGNRPGGRLASVMIDQMSWDLGAQSFLARDPDFIIQASAWQSNGWIEPWPDGPEGSFVGLPTMASLVAAQSARHDTRFGMRVERIESSSSGWYIAGPDFLVGPFSALVIAVPAEQASVLLSLQDLDMAREAAAVRSSPCWSVMAAFPEPISGNSHIVYPCGPLATATCSKSKPGRGEVECWTLQASLCWSRENLEMPRDEVACRLLDHFGSKIRGSLPPATFAKAHRWRFARPSGRESPYIWNDRSRLGTCGDWCIGPSVEEAWQSGSKLGRHLVQVL